MLPLRHGEFLGSPALVARANLLTRLVVLVVIATLPAVVVLAMLEADMRAERMSRLGYSALHQAEVINADLATVVAGAHQLGLTVSLSATARALDPGCASHLDELRARLPAYAFLAVAGASGTAVCSSGLVPAPSTPALQSILAAARRNGGFAVGSYLSSPAGAVLPFAFAFTAETGQAAAVFGGLSLDWLDQHLAELNQPADSTTLVMDRRGTVLARFPDGARYVGQPIKAQNMRVVNAPVPGIMEARGFDNAARMVGYVPANDSPIGLAIAVGLPRHALMEKISAATARGYALIGAGVLLSLLLALVVGQRYVRAPTKQLLRAARLWAAGDLSARASLREAPTTEFGSIAVAFNGMADSLFRQHTDLQEANEMLETRVAERTEALLESNNRLQALLSEQERAEDSLRQAQKLQAVGQLAAGIAHDFNNLLAAVIGSLELLKRRLAADPVAQQQAQRAIASAERGTRLTAQLLAFARHQRLMPTRLDLNASVNSVVDLVGGTLSRDITLAKHLDADLWPALADAGQVEVAILNLILNARDAMPQGGTLKIATRNLRLETPKGTGLQPGDYVELAVADSGTGMTPEVRARAFEPFFTTRGIGQGSGLGLSQVHGMALQSGGDVGIESTPGEGTWVTLLLPRAPADMTPALPPAPTSAGGAATILLVDDDADVRSVIAGILTEAGFQVLTRADAASGLATLTEAGAEVQLLIADYAMPGMTGIDLIHAAHANRPDLKVILATGYADFDTAASMAGLDPDNVIRKPFRSSELLDRIGRVLA